MLLTKVKVQVFRLVIAVLALKFTKFLLSFLEQRFSFSSNFASLFNVMRHNSSVLFHLNLYMLWSEEAHQKKFPDFQLLARKLSKCLKSFFKLQVSFPLHFASPFSVMTHNFSEIYQLKHYMLLTKRTHQCTIFQTLSARMKVHPIPHANFETTRSGFIQILHHCPVPWKITPLYFFQLKPHIL